jgi:hypothetical protein
MMIRIACAGAVLAFSVLSAHGQAAKVVLKGAEELGSSPAARELLAGAARQSGLAKRVLEALGFHAESEAAAVKQLESLSATDFGSALIRRSELDAARRPPDMPNPSLTCGVLCRSALQDYGKYTLGAAGTVPLSIYVDSLVRKQNEH